MRFEHITQVWLVEEYSQVTIHADLRLVLGAIVDEAHRVEYIGVFSPNLLDTVLLYQ